VCLSDSGSSETDGKSESISVPDCLSCITNMPNSDSVLPSTPFVFATFTDAEIGSPHLHQAIFVIGVQIWTSWPQSRMRLRNFRMRLMGKLV
jgi:hypothetical protein